MSLIANRPLVLTLLRENVLGKARFDSAFSYYVHTWAFKHPTPYDFFIVWKTMQEKLDWFWRGWFMNQWKIDQSVEDVAYIGESRKRCHHYHCKQRAITHACNGRNYREAGGNTN